MARRTFRRIIGFSFVYVLFEILIYIVTRHSLPRELLDYKLAAMHSRHAATPMWLQVASAVMMLVAVANYAGLYFFNPLSRPLCLVLTGLALLLSLRLGPRIDTRAFAIASDIGGLLNGGILALIYFSPIQEYFKRPLSAKSPQPEGIEGSEIHD